MEKLNLVGQRFGQLIVKERIEETSGRYCQWLCVCDCGNEVVYNTRHLRRGAITNCGCVPSPNAKRGPVAENLTGNKYGKLTALYQVESKNGRTRWMCRCDCGTEKVVAARDLKYGNTKSCGCARYRKPTAKLDLKGRQFGRLTACYPLEKRNKRSSIYWHCICECGNEKDVPEERLLYGKYRSCGCLKFENQRNIFEKLHMVDGTCIEWLEKRKNRSDNTSGYRGVYHMKNGKYRVGIGFKGQRFHLGTYEDFDDAVNARMEVEKLLHEGFVQSYYSWKELADQDPHWAENNPFHYDVEKCSDGFSINSNCL